MTERVLGPTGGQRRKRLALFLPFMAIAALILAIGASAGPVSNAAGFEGDDGNLAPNPNAQPNDGPIINFDWNSFAPTDWTGTAPAPYRTSTRTVNGWKFVGLEDAQNDSNDTVFSGGTKQDDDCAKVGEGPKPPNKDDLKRAYLASKIVSGKVYLALAWARIPQNTTSASAHVAFEFNQGTTPCPAGSNGLVRRTADNPATPDDNEGDMLIVYDFEGGSGPVILKLLRWQVSGTCEQTGKAATSAGCWVLDEELVSSAKGEARVNTETASDGIAPSPPDQLQSQEFGEAIVNLTDAGVFPTTGCRTFGNVYAVSRSSGNSGQAAMKDLVGPGDSGLSNCGSIKIIKETNPPSANVDFKFTSNFDGATEECTIGSTSDSTPNAFTLNAGAAATDDITCTQVTAGSYNVQETVADIPSGWAFDSVSCQVTGDATAAQDGTTTKVNITLPAGGTVVCTYANKQVTGAIEITKTGKDKNCTGASATCQANGNAFLAGAKFEIWKETNSTAGLQRTASNGTPADTKAKNEQTTSTNGKTCFDGLAFGDYYAFETATKAGYKIDNDTSAKQTISAAGTCAPSGTVVGVSFTNTPLSTVRIQFTSLAGAGVTASAIVCKTAANATVPANTENGSPDPAYDDTDETFGNGTTTLVPGVYTCTIDIDP